MSTLTRITTACRSHWGECIRLPGIGRPAPRRLLDSSSSPPPTEAGPGYARAGAAHPTGGPTWGFFPAIQKSVVVPDPPGRRAGSGGATLGVLRELFTQFNLRDADLDQLRILLIHSGGASQRLPAYSPLGKIFAPLPLLRPDRQISTLFDHLYLTLAGLPERLGPGMLIVAGDVFLLFDHPTRRAPRA